MFRLAAVAVIVASSAVVATVFGLVPAAYSNRSATAEAISDMAGGQHAAAQALSGESMKGRVVEGVGGGCANCGVVEALRTFHVQGQGSGLGAVAGGVTGAVAGSQLGKGNGRTVLGILGAVGGAYAGHAIERNVRSGPSYRVTVRMEDGSTRSVYSAAPPTFAIGDRVRVLNGTLVAQG